MFSLKTLGKNPFSVPAFGRILEASGGLICVPWFVAVWFQSTSLFTCHSLCVLSFLRILFIGFRVHPNPGWSHFKIFTLITYAKTCSAHYLRFWVHIYFRGHNSHHYSPPSCPSRPSHMQLNHPICKKHSSLSHHSPKFQPITTWILKT